MIHYYLFFSLSPSLISFSPQQRFPLPPPPLSLSHKIFFSVFLTAACALGINYGQIAKKLPHPEAVIPLAKSIGVTRVKLYDVDPHVLKAFTNTRVEFVVGLGNEYFTAMSDIVGLAELREHEG